MKRLIALLCMGCVCLLNRQLPGQSDSITGPWNSTEARQFDFWIGTWDVNLRMIQPDNTWKDSVAAKVEIYPILDGKAILELWDSKPIKGFSLRYYDPKLKKWVLYLNWPGNSLSSSIGTLKGGFRHGRGEFFSGDGKQISRYTFCDITADSLRWDDAFSKDGGKTWTNNWIMEFSRTADRAAWPSGTEAHTWNSGGRCQGKEFDRINAMAGRWEGEINFGDDLVKIPATITAYRILDGCSIIRFLEYRHEDITYRNFGLLSWNARRGEFEELRLDNRPETAADIYRGKPVADSITVDAEFERDGKSTARRQQWFVDQETLRLVVSKRSGESRWNEMTFGNFTRINDGENEEIPGQKSSGEQREKDHKQEDHKQEDSKGEPAMEPINTVCPRSGKPVSQDSLTNYRSHVVGFCNTKCRDDFAANVEDRESDRKFFDDLIDNKQ